MSLSLFGDSFPGPAAEAARKHAPARRTPRDYQERITGQAVSFLRAGRSPLTVAATGTGKTFIGAAVVSALKDRRVLWVAHRIELVSQARGALEDLIGERVEAETVGQYSTTSRVVVASRDTVRMPRRLARLAAYAPFDVIVFDECHHTPAQSYQTIAKSQPGAVFYGLTATPGRMDGLGLRLFNERTEPFGIVEATRAGWLVPIRAQRCRVIGIDLSGVHVQAGDFRPAELRAVLASEANLHAMAKLTMESAGARPTLGFDVGVDQANRMTEIMNRYRPGCARSVNGETPAEERRVLFRDFGRVYQFLNNVDVATEGTDLPAAACVSMRRPTMSATVFQQQLGRVLRPEPGIDGATDRAAWIARSNKPDALVLDFVGNAGKHSVQTAAAAYTDDVEVQRRVGKRLAAGEEMLVQDVVEEEARKVESLRRVRDDKEKRRAALKVSNIRTEVDEISLIGMGGAEWTVDHGMDDVATPAQVDTLLALGCQARDLDGLSRAGARGKILGIRAARSLATPRQLDFIKSKPSLAHHWGPGLSKKMASRLIGSFITKSKRRYA